MKLKKQQVVDLYEIITKFKTEKVNKELAYANMINLRGMGDVIGDLEVINPKTIGEKIQQDFEEERTELIKKYAKKDDDGEFIIEEDKFTFEEENEKLFKDELDIIVSKYNKEYAEANELWHNVMKEEVNLDLRLIKLKQLPEKMTTNEIEILSIILEDDNDGGE